MMHCDGHVAQTLLALGVLFVRLKHPNLFLEFSKLSGKLAMELGLVLQAVFVNFENGKSQPY